MLNSIHIAPKAKANEFLLIEMIVGKDHQGQVGIDASHNFISIENVKN